MDRPPPGRRKTRTLRQGAVPDDLLLVVRAVPLHPSAAVEAMATDAEVSGRVYAVLREDGSRTVLFGVSVFGRQSDAELLEILFRFPHALGFLEASVGQLRAAGFEVLPTGSHPRHFDIQLVGGVAEDAAQPSMADLRRAAYVILGVAGPTRANPAYAGNDSEDE